MPTTLLPLGQFHFAYSTPEPIGRGGLGCVYRIRVTESNCPSNPVGADRALKCLNDRWAQQPEMIARFEREITALKKMSHENIMACEGENLPGNARFYVMPLFASSVRRHVSTGGFRNDWRGVATQGVILADALAYAHRCGFIHRDIKPDNLLFNPGGPIVIADWGLGYFVHKHSLVLEQATVGGMGTEYYCSIEQWGTGKCDARGDVYALGMTLDEWVTGRQRRIQVGDGVASPTTHEPSAGAQRFNAVVHAMTKPKKAERITSMEEVATHLRAAINLR